MNYKKKLQKVNYIFQKLTGDPQRIQTLDTSDKGFKQTIVRVLYISAEE